MAKRCHPNDDFMFGKDSSVYEFRNIRTFKKQKSRSAAFDFGRMEQL
ncbi:hypothetical protein [Treponema sp. Marseille-Q4130]|nr:hypothetical protein [Treponema sp. Marseille-Q4130]MBC6720952.1 hypothetical protein [Treponema sp. Marseille-Q4130]